KGTELILAVPDTFPCTSSSNHADIFVADATSGAIRTKWKSGISVGDLAVTTDSRVWAVDSRNFGAVKNHDPKMRVFDLNTGKQLKDLPGRDSGVRYAVAASRSGDRIAAYTSKMKTVVDWLDGTSFPAAVDVTFSIWNSASFEGLMTSQDLRLPE